jgi:hypothetical protein
VATSPARTDRWKALDFGPPSSDSDEPDLPVLVEYTQDERVAVIMLNRPHADNAITTAMGRARPRSWRRSRFAPQSVPSSSPEPAAGPFPSAATSASART